MRFKPPEEKEEAQELLRREQSRTAPKVGERRTSRQSAAGGSGAAGGGTRRARIYLLRDDKAQPVEIQLGITDGSRTEVRSGDVKENDPVIIGMSSADSSGPAVANPFQPQRSRGFGLR
jgi:HlyD family secretion protein